MSRGPKEQARRQLSGPARRKYAYTHINFSWTEFDEVKAYADSLSVRYGVPVSTRAAIVRAVRLATANDKATGGET